MSFYTLLDHQAEFVVLHKSPGIAVQGDPNHPSVLELVRQDLALAALYPVHRLDMGTSGIVVAAKTPEANRQLSMAFQNREVEKQYLALTSKKPTKKQGWVVGDMEKARGGNYRLLRQSLNPARTQLKSFAWENGLRIWLLKPFTGKTHQLRVALKSLGSPIIGDERYGGDTADRLYLHAWKLSFHFQGNVYDYQALPQHGELFVSDAFQKRLQALIEGNEWTIGN